MKAFLIFHSTVKDPEKFAEYAQAVGPTLKPFGGEVALRGKAGKILCGDHLHQNLGVLRFPNHDAALDWYKSEAYQALIKNRDQAANMTVISYEEPPA